MGNMKQKVNATAHRILAGQKLTIPAKVFPQLETSSKKLSAKVVTKDNARRDCMVVRVEEIPSSRFYFPIKDICKWLDEPEIMLKVMDGHHHLLGAAFERYKTFNAKASGSMTPDSKEENSGSELSGIDQGSQDGSGGSLQQAGTKKRAKQKSRGGKLKKANKPTNNHKWTLDKKLTKSISGPTKPSVGNSHTLAIHTSNMCNATTGGEEDAATCSTSDTTQRVSESFDFEDDAVNSERHFACVTSPLLICTPLSSQHGHTPITQTARTDALYVSADTKQAQPTTAPAQPSPRLPNQSPPLPSNTHVVSHQQIQHYVSSQLRAVARYRHTTTTVSPPAPTNCTHDGIQPASQGTPAPNSSISQTALQPTPDKNVPNGVGPESQNRAQHTGLDSEVTVIREQNLKPANGAGTSIQLGGGSKAMDVDQPTEHKQVANGVVAQQIRGGTVTVCGPPNAQFCNSKQLDTIAGAQMTIPSPAQPITLVSVQKQHAEGGGGTNTDMGDTGGKMGVGEALNGDSLEERVEAEVDDTIVQILYSNGNKSNGVAGGGGLKAILQGSGGPQRGCNGVVVGKALN